MIGLGGDQQPLATSLRGRLCDPATPDVVSNTLVAGWAATTSPHPKKAAFFQWVTGGSQGASKIGVNDHSRSGGSRFEDEWSFLEALRASTGSPVQPSEKMKIGDVVPLAVLTRLVIAFQQIWHLGDHRTVGYDGDMGKVNDQHQIGDQEERELTDKEQMALADKIFEKLASPRISETPRERLAEAALGKRRVEMSDLEGTLAGLVTELEMQASLSGSTARVLIAMILSTPPSTSPSQEDLLFGEVAPSSFDVNAALGLAERLTRLNSIQISELRKTVDLLARIVRPDRPRVQVLAAVRADQINVGQNSI